MTRPETRPASRLLAGTGSAADGMPGVAAAQLGVAVVGLVGFVLLTVLVALRGNLPFDGPLRDTALAWHNLYSLWDLISNAANFPLIGIAAAIILWLLYRHRRREALLVFIALALVTAGSEGVKQLVHRPRPPASNAVVPGVIYSYPSGHELESVVILGIVALLVWRSGAPKAVRVAVAVAVILFCAAVAVARVAIDAHWPSDVLAGFLGGIGVLALVADLTRPAAAPAHAPRTADA